MVIAPVQSGYCEPMRLLLSQKNVAHKLWLQMEKYWHHLDLPSGQRFLGSIGLSKKDTEKLLDTLRDSFALVHPFTFEALDNKFQKSDTQRYWIKLTTLALAEYAYYDDGNKGFWEGLCERLNLKNPARAQGELRKVLYEGFKILGVVESKQSNYYVSTLWLQSGIPEQNLPHFAQLLQELSQEFGWWEISHANPEDLAETMCSLCSHRHPQWGKLLTFLRSSYPQDDGEVEPLSGRLLQGIAIVAQELERRGQSPEILSSSESRDRFLQNYCLPHNFFLRSWANLIEVLTPRQQNNYKGRSLVSYRKKPLRLMLDVADSMNILLYLPGQTLKQAQWKNLSESYCLIQEADWEGDLSSTKTLEIQDISQVVKQIQQQWCWNLKNSSDRILTSWTCEGVGAEFPHLVFDAWTGERLDSQQGLEHSQEIICYCPADTRLNLSREIEIVDSYVPCSIRGWKGQQLLLTGREGAIEFIFSSGSKLLQWNQFSTAYPQLRGLKLKGKNLIYIDVPALWYPPVSTETSVKIIIEDLDRRCVITAPDETITVTTNEAWQRINLSRWIRKGGHYGVQLWGQGDRWSQKFGVRAALELDTPLQLSPLQILESDRTADQIPLQVSSAAQFWLADLALEGLWPYEEIKLLLTDGINSEYDMVRASASGNSRINPAIWRDSLPSSDYYELKYQRIGDDWQYLLILTSESLSEKHYPVIITVVSAPTIENHSSKKSYGKNIQKRDSYYIH
ncbi:MAG: hypothetical protein N5P05_003645 [Chroococcopsis gigantea SAG 12.99]|jgi:hypothetical protein|nr:hypothetical protein [Chroococcopsis gigantea SAG 12.99]